MKRISGIIILSVLTLAGCATPTSEYTKAKEINTIESFRAYIKEYPYSQYTRTAENKIAELSEKQRRNTQIKQSWDKLRKGMSVDEVDSLIGPLNRGAVASLRYLSDNAKRSARTGNRSTAGSDFPYRGRYFTLIFDASGKLSSWSLK